MIGIASLGGLLSSALIKSLLDKVLFFLALKALLTALFIIVMPIVINNLIHNMMSDAMTLMNSTFISQGAASGMIQVTGFCAWLSECLRIPECISMLVSALQAHMILKLIPFSPVK